MKKRQRHVLQILSRRLNDIIDNLLLGGDDDNSPDRYHDELVRYKSSKGNE